MNIALADSDNWWLGILSRVLAANGHDVEPFTGGDALLRALGEKTYGLIIIEADVEAINTIRNTEKTKNLPVIVVSSDRMPRELEKFDLKYIVFRDSSYTSGAVLHAIKQLPAAQA